jgi:hypothetical protein
VACEPASVFEPARSATPAGDRAASETRPTEYNDWPAKVQGAATKFVERVGRAIEDQAIA